jgi:hypothetical protein
MGSNTSRKILEKLVDVAENRGAQKTKTMLRTITVVLVTNPSRSSRFIFDPETTNIMTAFSIGVSWPRLITKPSRSLSSSAFDEAA